MRSAGTSKIGPFQPAQVSVGVAFDEFQRSPQIRPLFLEGDAIEVLKQLPPDSIDCAITSPPYWGKREYAGGGTGLESDYREFVRGLLATFGELHRVLKPTGSFWLNLGDSYLNKNLLCIPWRVAIGMTDSQGWIMRNSVVWNKVKGGPDNSDDKLRNIHEPVLHFVKRAKSYYYDVDAIRATPKKAQVVNGAVVSATGVSGVRYKRQIELSSELNEHEKANAMKALDQILDDIRAAKLADFRMIIRGQQRATHSDAQSVSGRARDLALHGFYFMKYHPGGSKPGDVWDIMPEDTQSRSGHFAPFPEDLCKIPILATCPPEGIVLDPFCGTGTANFVAHRLGRKSVGIDISSEYLKFARERCGMLL